jgi:hypothetical protein
MVLVDDSDMFVDFINVYLKSQPGNNQLSKKNNTKFTRLRLKMFASFFCDNMHLLMLPNVIKDNIY